MLSVLENTYPVNIQTNYSIVQVTGGYANSQFFGCSAPSPGLFNFSKVVRLKGITFTSGTVAIGGAGDRVNANSFFVAIELYKFNARLGGLWNSNQYQWHIQRSTIPSIIFPQGLEITQLVWVNNVGLTGGQLTNLANYTSLDSARAIITLYIDSENLENELWKD